MRESRSYGSVGEPVGNHRLYPEEDGEVLTLTSYPIIGFRPLPLRGSASARFGCCGIEGDALKATLHYISA